MRISLADVFLTLLVRRFSWEAFLVFSLIRHGSLRMNQNMMVVCWAKGCQDEPMVILLVYLYLKGSGTDDRTKEGQSTRLDGTDRGDMDGKTLFCRIFQSLVTFSFILHTSMKSHCSHMPWMPTKDTLTVRGLLFTALALHGKDILWWKISGPGFLD